MPRSPSEAGSREAILESAVDVVARNGVPGARVEDIAAGARVSLGLLNYHFGSRSSLLRAALVAGLEQHSVPSGASVRELLQSGLAEEPQGPGGWWRIRLEALRMSVFDAEVRAAVTISTEAWRAAITRELGGRPRDGEDALLLIGLVDGLRQRVASGVMLANTARALLDEALARTLETGAE